MKVYITRNGRAEAQIPFGTSLTDFEADVAAVLRQMRTEGVPEHAKVRFGKQKYNSQTIFATWTIEA